MLGGWERLNQMNGVTEFRTCWLTAVGCSTPPATGSSSPQPPPGQEAGGTELLCCFSVSFGSALAPSMHDGFLPHCFLGTLHIPGSAYLLPDPTASPASRRTCASSEGSAKFWQTTFWACYLKTYRKAGGVGRRAALQGKVSVYFRSALPSSMLWKQCCAQPPV